MVLVGVGRGCRASPRVSGANGGTTAPEAVRLGSSPCREALQAAGVEWFALKLIVNQSRNAILLCLPLPVLGLPGLRKFIQC